MSDLATLSTDAASVNAVFAAWLAAHPSALTFTETKTFGPLTLQVQGAPTRPPTVRPGEGTLDLQLAAYAVTVSRVDAHGAHPWLRGSASGTLSGPVAVTDGHLQLGAITADLTWDGDRIAPDVVQFVVDLLTQRYQGWPLPQPQVITGLRAAVHSATFTPDHLQVVAGCTCAPAAALAAPASTPSPPFTATVSADVPIPVVQTILDCAHVSVEKEKRKHVKVGPVSATGKLEVKLTDLHVKLHGGQLSGSCSLHVKAKLSGVGPTDTVHPNLELTLGTSDDGKRVQLTAAVGWSRRLMTLPGWAEELIDDLIQLVNLALSERPFTILRLDDPFALFGLDVALALSDVGTSDDGVRATVEATASPARTPAAAG